MSSKYIGIMTPNEVVEVTRGIISDRNPLATWELGVLGFPAKEGYLLEERRFDHMAACVIVGEGLIQRALQNDEAELASESERFTNAARLIFDTLDGLRHAVPTEDNLVFMENFGLDTAEDVLEEIRRGGLFNALLDGTDGSDYIAGEVLIAIEHAIKASRKDN